MFAKVFKTAALGSLLASSFAFSGVEIGGTRLLSATADHPAVHARSGDR